MATTAAADNSLGITGIEFIEYATTQPLVFGALLEQMGFIAIARHRSREVTLYRQGGMNIVVNADGRALPSSIRDDIPATVISAVAMRVRDADTAYRHAVDMGAWAMQSRVGVMELNIPGVHGAGDSIVYFTDRVGDFSIYDVDFKPIPDVPQEPPALAGMHFFGIVQSIDEGRAAEWLDFYRQVMNFEVLPEGQFFGAVPKGILLASPCRQPAMGRTAGTGRVRRAGRARRRGADAPARHCFHRPGTGTVAKQGRTDPAVQRRRQL
jgi:4-hydroxyphenylpyruvate dioxygenase